MTVRITKPEFNLREKLSELDKPVGLKGSELIRSNGAQDARDLIGAGRKNIIINGAMNVAQRNTTKTSITTQGYYTCDRWHVQLHGPTLRLEQDSDNPGYGFKKSLAVTTTTAVASIAAGNAIKLRYLIEGYDVAQLQYGTTHAKPFTLSFWVKSSLTGQFAISFSRDSRIVNRQVTVNSANTWEHKSITILGDVTTALGNTTDGTGMIINIFPSAGANSTDGASLRQWNSYHNAHTAYGANMGHLTTTGSVFKITGVQMEVGKVATEFEHLSRQEELALCYRYYRRFSPYSPTGTDNYCGFGVGLINQSGGGIWSFPLDIPMRDRPSITQNNLRIYDGSGNQNISAMNTNRSSQSSIWVEPATGTSSFTVGRAFLIGGNNTAGGYVELDAEL